MSSPFERASDTGSAFKSGQDLEHSPFLSESYVSTRSTSVAVTEPKFAKLLTAGCDMTTVLEAMDQELSAEDILGLFRMDLARPPMPEEPVPDPDYKPRPSTGTGRPPVDARHSKKETERRAQHKHYLDLSEIKIPDFFLELCGWEEPRGSGSKRTPRTKSSVLQAGCLYMWFLSGPVLRCLKNLPHNNKCLQEKAQQLENENRSLRLRYESLQSEAQSKTEHTNAAVREPLLQSPSLAVVGCHCSLSSLAPSVAGFTILEDLGSSAKSEAQLSRVPDCPTMVLSKCVKRRSASVSSHEEPDRASPTKKRKTTRHFTDKQAAAVRLTFDDDIENSFPNVDSVRDQNKDELTPTQMYRLRLSSAPSMQSATPSCWDSASIMSTGSFWDQPSPYSIVDS